VYEDELPLLHLESEKHHPRILGIVIREKCPLVSHRLNLLESRLTRDLWFFNANPLGLQRKEESLDRLPHFPLWCPVEELAEEQGNALVFVLRIFSKRSIFSCGVRLTKAATAASRSPLLSRFFRISSMPHFSIFRGLKSTTTTRATREFSSQTYADSEASCKDKSKERYAQMGMPVSSIVIQRQCCPHHSAPRVVLNLKALARRRVSDYFVYSGLFDIGGMKRRRL
jgi:hypothetical protein